MRRPETRNRSGHLAPSGAARGRTQRTLYKGRDARRNE